MSHITASCRIDVSAATLGAVGFMANRTGKLVKGISGSADLANEMKKTPQAATSLAFASEKYRTTAERLDMVFGAWGTALGIVGTANAVGGGDDGG